jgi:hypothetical protein
LALAYLVVPGALAWRGWLSRYEAPPTVLLLVGALTLMTAGICFSGIGARLREHNSLAWLVGFQAFRVPVELLLHRLYGEGVIPVQMTYEGRNFDIVSGAGAALLGLLLWRGVAVPQVVLWLWNVVGLGLLLNIVGVAILSAPVPFRYFVDGVPNLLPSTFPYVWLPSFLVQAALAGHLLVWRALRQGR